MVCTFWLPNVRFATASCNFWTSELQKVVPDRQFFHIFTSERAFRHSGVQFFDIWTSKSVPDRQFFHIFTSECAFRHSGVQFFHICTFSSPNVVEIFDISTSKSAWNPTCFEDFDFQMCLSPQRRTIFRHLNFKKWSRIVSFLTFSLPNVLFATAACNFSTSELQKVVPDRQFFHIFTSKCAFRHSGVQFFHIWTSKSAPKLTCFVHFRFKMCFSPQRRAIFDFSADHMTPHPPL